MKIFIASDHRGFALKEYIKLHLNSSLVKEETPPKAGEEFETIDCGPATFVKDDDYVDYGIAAITKMEEGDRSILLCGSGHGMDMLANRYPNMRAILGFNESVVQQGREHEDANVLIIPSDWTSNDQAIILSRIFLETPFSNEERHIRRIKKLSEI